MENAVFWDIKPSSYLIGKTLHRYKTQPVNANVILEVFTAVTMMSYLVLFVRTDIS
jgi:hypothetical protein